jgi:hypothetical protein
MILFMKKRQGKLRPTVPQVRGRTLDPNLGLPRGRNCVSRNLAPQSLTPRPTNIIP